MNKLIKSISLRSLADENNYKTPNDKSPRKINSFKSFFTLKKRSIRENFSCSFEEDEDPPNLGSTNFRSFVRKSFLETEQPKETPSENVEDLIAQFLTEEQIFREKLEILLENLNNLDIETKFDLETMLGNFLKYISDVLLEDLRESSSDINKFIDSLKDHTDLFIMYKNILVAAYKLEKFCSKNKEIILTFDEDFLSLPKHHLINFLIFLHKAKKHCDNSENISWLIQTVSQIINVENELKIRDILAEILKAQTLHLERCSKFIIEVIPLLDANIKYRNKSAHIIGQIPEIYKEETLLYDEIKTCALAVDASATELAKAFLKHSVLFELYMMDTRRDRAIKEAFCKDNNVEDKIFLIVVDHLFTLKYLFTNLKDLLESGKKDCYIVDKFLQKIHSTLQHIDHLMAAGKIIGESINLQTQGNILLRNKFRVKYEKDNPYEAMVFLFEKCMVFTKEQTLTPGLNVYTFENYIVIDRLGFDDAVEKSGGFLVFSQEKRTKSNMHLISSTSPLHGNVEEWKGKIKDILMDQMRKSRDLSKFIFNDL